MIERTSDTCICIERTDTSAITGTKMSLIRKRGGTTKFNLEIDVREYNLISVSGLYWAI